jgi:hypothetical protein
MAEHDEARKAALQATLSSGAAGGLYGLGFAAISGKKKALELAKFAAKAGLISGSVGGGGVYAGSRILGMPSEEETTGMTRRATTGGALIGGAAGMGVGALAGSGALKANPKSNLIGEYLAKIGSRPGLKSATRGAAVTGLAGSLIGAYLGNDEGMMLDFIDQEKKQRQRIDEAQKQAMLRGAQSNG